MKYSSNH